MTDGEPSELPAQAAPAAMTGPEPFEYSRDQWNAVLTVVPADKATDTALMKSVRQQLETAGSEYRALAFHHRQRFPKGAASPAIAWERRRDLIAKALAEVEPNSSGIAAYVGHLKEAHRIAEAQAIGLRMLGQGHKGKLNPARDHLYEQMLGVWTRELMGKLTAGSTHRAGRREATSPAIRFFEAAVAPIVTDHPIKPDAIAKIIKAERKRREEMAVAIEKATARTR
jgi:hypothetical protein